ncbi:MAG: GTP cyclohydrolase I [Deltaproteobacteria bacterium]|nr:GTP cyclohydrolase I [Deltaproteobacteria bacterium]
MASRARRKHLPDPAGAVEDEAKVSEPERSEALQREAAAAAVRSFLHALGIDVDDPELQHTPDRVARAWIEVLVAGQRHDPAEALGELHVTTGRGPVIVSKIPFLSTCPHHLLPLIGHADIAFVPNGRVPGFGRIAQLLDVLAHRLVLQETLGQSFVDAFSDHVGSIACACLLRARHTCVAVTDPSRMDSPFTTIATKGDETVAAELVRLLTPNS